MSADDVLSRATRALRDDGAVLPPREALVARARVMNTVRKKERRRTRVVLLLAPIAAVLVASTALANNETTRRRVLQAIATHVWHAEPAREVAPVPPPISAPTRPSPAPTPTPTPAPAAPAAAPAAPAPVPAPRAEAKAPPVAPAAPLPRADAPRARPDAELNARPTPPLDDGEAAALAAYGRAHRLHFLAHDYASAVAAWDEYLRVAPAGRLGVEARYNRAIALLRAGREAEGRAALAPFARGEVAGGYRRAEARALLDALGGAP